MTQAIFSSEPETTVSGQFFPPKVFAQPFRLAFKRGDSTDTATWVEVRSLDGLRKVFGKVAKGELVEIDRAASVEMQLWGHLAEHSGFLRTQHSASMLDAGIQPLGSGLAPLTEDLSALLGGDEVSALRTLDRMKTALKTRADEMEPIGQVPSAHEYVKPDGVNLTKDGEDALHGLVFGVPNEFPDRNPDAAADATKFRKTAENAVEIFVHQTPNATPDEVQAESEEAATAAALSDSGVKPSEGAVKTGHSAAKAGRLLADVRRGLDNEPDKETQDMSEAGVTIFESMVEPKPNPRLLPPGSPSCDPLAALALEEFRTNLRKIFPELRGLADHQLTAKRILSELDKAADRIPGLEAFHTTFEEMKRLSGINPQTAWFKEMKRLAGVKPTERRVAPTEVAGRDNIDKILKTVDLETFVAQSELPNMTPEEETAHRERAEQARQEAERTDRTYYSPGKSPYEKEEKAKALNPLPKPGAPYGGDHYKSREVSPASGVPTDQDARAEWLASNPPDEFLVDGRPVHDPEPDPDQDKS